MSYRSQADRVNDVSRCRTELQCADFRRVKFSDALDPLCSFAAGLVGQVGRLSCITWLLAVPLGSAICGAQEVPLENPQPQVTQAKPVAMKPVAIKGEVIQQNKYSVTVLADAKRYKVVVNAKTKVALLMNKPRFVWKTEQVLVERKRRGDPSEAEGESRSKATDRGDIAKGRAPRVAFSIPSGQLYLIARFRTAEQRLRLMSSKEKRINQYLITPEELDLHEPNDAELYLSGKLTAGKVDGTATLETDEKTHKIRLGYRFATMNGFSIADLKAGETGVSIFGSWDPAAGQIVASNVAFEPLVKN